MRHLDVFPVPREWLSESDIALSETIENWAEKEVIQKRLSLRESYDSLLLPAMKSLFCDVGLQKIVVSEDGEYDKAAYPITAVLACEHTAMADTGISALLSNLLVFEYLILWSRDCGCKIPDELLKILEKEKPVICSLVLPMYGRKGQKPQKRLNGLCYQVEIQTENSGFFVTGSGVRPQVSGHDASVYLVLAGDNNGEPVLLVVPREARGVLPGEPLKSTGLAASRNADVDFNDVEIGEEYIVARGDEYLSHLQNLYYATSAAAALGAVLACFDIHREWGNTRVIKGKRNIFKENPLVASLMGTIASRIASARFLVYGMGKMIADLLHGKLPAASASFFISAATAHVFEIATTCVDNMMEHMASAGYATEWNLERYWRDIKTLESYVLPGTVLNMRAASHSYGVKNL